MDCSLELDPTNVCRICLEPQGNPLSILTKHIIEGNIKTFPEIILSCFHIDVISNPNLPKNICETCKSSIIQFFKLKDNVVRTEKLLTEIFKTDDEVILKEEDFGADDVNDDKSENTVQEEVEDDGEYEDQYVEDVQLDIVEDVFEKNEIQVIYKIEDIDVEEYSLE